MTRLQYHSPWVQSTAVAYGEFVPVGEVWLVQFVGIVSNDATAAEFMLQVEQHVGAPDGPCCWLVPAQADPGYKSATPKFAANRSYILEAGDRFAARTHVLMSDLAILYSGWRFPASDLERLIFGQGAT